MEGREERINNQLRSDVSEYDYKKEVGKEIDLNAYRWNAKGILLCIINIICFVVYFGYRGYYMKEYGIREVWFPIYSAAIEFVYMSSMVIYSFYLVIKPVYQTTPQKEPRERYTIRVLIPCYKEDSTILFATLQSAFRMIVPEKSEMKIYLCDDGNDNKRDSLLCDCKEMFGQRIYAEKISGRKKNGKSINGKSENLNYSLEWIYKEGDKDDMNELIVIFDADQIPAQDFLLRLVHNFDYDKRIGLVVTPQKFSNTERYADIFNHYNIQFWEYILPAFDCTHTIFCTGSNFIMRARALNTVGGMPQDTVTEDFELGILLIKAGYKAKYYTDYLAIGEAPADIKDIYKQRSRWTKGAFQVLFKKDSPLRKKMKPIQKLMYASCIYTYIAAIITYPLQQTIPLIALLMGVFPFYITIESVTVLVGTIFFQQLIVFYTAKKNKRHHIYLFYYSGVAAYLYWYTYLKAVIRAIIGRVTKRVSGFKVTPKTQAVKKQESALSYTWPHYVFMVLQIIVLGYVIARDIAYDKLVGVEQVRKLVETEMQKKYTRWPNLKRIDLFDVSNICWMGLNQIPVMLLIVYGIYRKIENNINNTLEAKKKAREFLKGTCVTGFYVSKIILVLLGGFLYAILYKKVKQNDTYYIQYNNYINQQNEKRQQQIQEPMIEAGPYSGYIPIIQGEPEVKERPIERRIPAVEVPKGQAEEYEEQYRLGYGINLKELRNKTVKVQNDISEIKNTIVGNILPYYNNQNVSYQEVKNKTYDTTSFQMDFFDFPLDELERQKLVYLESQCQYYKSICVVQIQTSNGYNYTNQTIVDLQKILNEFRVINYVVFNREMNGQWYEWKGAPSGYRNEYRRFFENIEREAHDIQTVKRVWNPNTQESYPDYGLGNPVLPRVGTEDFRLLDTNRDGKIDSKDDAYTPYYPGDDEVDIISTSVYNFGSTGRGNGNNIVPKEGTIENFLDKLYKFSVKQKKPFGIMETGSLWINNNTRSPKTNATEYEVKRAWIEQVFNYTKVNENTKFVLFLQESKIEDQLENTCNNKVCSVQQQTVDWEFYNMQDITQFYINQIQQKNFTINAEKVYIVE